MQNHLDRVLKKTGSVALLIYISRIFCGPYILKFLQSEVVVVAVGVIVVHSSNFSLSFIICFETRAFLKRT